MSHKRVLAIAVLAAASGLLAVLYALRHDDAHHTHAFAALERTVLRVEPGEPLSVGGFVDAEGKSFDARRLRGRWSVVFFGYTSCPDVCPTTLATLAAFARNAASGVADGSVQIVFVSVDPDHDTPQRLKAYLGAFHPGIVGLAGSREAVQRFAAEVGGGYQASPSGIDHSTSLFVVDPQGRTVAVLLHPDDPARIVADLASVRRPSS